MCSLCQHILLALRVNGVRYVRYYACNVSAETGHHFGGLTASDHLRAVRGGLAFRHHRPPNTLREPRSYFDVAHGEIEQQLSIPWWRPR
jgi:hypothetical protein